MDTKALVLGDIEYAIIRQGALKRKVAGADPSHDGMKWFDEFQALRHATVIVDRLLGAYFGSEGVRGAVTAATLMDKVIVGPGVPDEQVVKAHVAQASQAIMSLRLVADQAFAVEYGLKALRVLSGAGLPKKGRKHSLSANYQPLPKHVKRNLEVSYRAVMDDDCLATVGLVAQKHNLIYQKVRYDPFSLTPDEVAEAYSSLSITAMAIEACCMPFVNPGDLVSAKFEIGGAT